MCQRYRSLTESAFTCGPFPERERTRNLRVGHKLVIAAVLLAGNGVVGSCTDIAVLRNGFSITHQHREQRGAQTRLYLEKTQENYVDVLTEDVVGFETDEPPYPQATPNTRPSQSLDQVVRAISSQNNIDPDLINSVIRTESGFNANAVSPKGAQGLMQLMPQTAIGLGVRDVMDPEANVGAGTRYLRELLSRYHEDLIKALAAYNAGPRRVDQYHGVPPYSETQSFVARILNDLHRKKLGESRSALVTARKGTELRPKEGAARREASKSSH